MAGIWFLFSRLGKKEWGGRCFLQMMGIPLEHPRTCYKGIPGRTLEESCSTQGRIHGEEKSEESCSHRNLWIFTVLTIYIWNLFKQTFAAHKIKIILPFSFLNVDITPIYLIIGMKIFICKHTMSLNFLTFPFMFWLKYFYEHFGEVSVWTQTKQCYGSVFCKHCH